MALPPEPKLAACLRVLYLASVKARSLGWEGESEGLTAAQSSEVAALMDAVHNIPHLIQNWETCNEDLLRGMLGDVDSRYGHGLLAVYDEYSGITNRANG